MKHVPSIVGVEPITLAGESAYVLCDHIDQCQAAIDVAAANLVMKWELADPRDRWRHTGEPPPAERASRPFPTPYRTPSSVIDAFWYVVRLGDSERLRNWLDRHEADREYLLKQLESKNAARNTQ